MALVIADRVKETTTTGGTGTVTLAGAVAGFQSFAAVGNGNTTYYTITDATNGTWEVGIGTYTASGTTLSRDTVLSSSSSGSLVSFAAISKDVFVTYPADRSVTSDYLNTFTVPQVVSVNSASDALRITQIGAGNALVVEDSANPDSTPFVVDASGNVMQGLSSPLLTSNDNGGGSANVSAGGNTVSGYAAVGINSTVARFAPNLTLKRNRGIYSSPTIVTSGDYVGRLDFQGYDGTAYIDLATIYAAVDGTPGTNDMPGRLVFQTTADGASSPTERMRIDNAGQVGIGGTPSAGDTIFVAKSATGATTSYGIRFNQSILSGVTSAFYGIASGFNTQSASFTLTNLGHFLASQGTFNSPSAVTNQYGFFASSNLTGATNNYGFYSNIASGTGRFNFYANGTAANYFAGGVGIGTTSTGGFNGTVNLGGSGSPASGFLEGYLNSQSIPSSATTRFDAYLSAPSTSAASFTITQVRHYTAQWNTTGASSAITNQYGFYVDSNITAATNNYGFYSDIASGTGRFNFYANGTAANFFGGPTIISVNSSSDALRITQTGAGKALIVEDAANPDSTPFVVNDNGQVLAGSTTSVATMFGTTPALGVFTTTGGDGLGNYRAGNDINGAAFVFQKTRGADSTVNTIVQSGDNLGILYWSGADGTNYIRGAQIAGQVDGTPGINDMPGRLVFSTTADGASSPTERLRIGSAGQIGLGGANYGTSGQVLTSNGSGSAPTWQTPSSGGAVGSTLYLNNVYGGF